MIAHSYLESKWWMVSDATQIYSSWCCVANICRREEKQFPNNILSSKLVCKIFTFCLAEKERRDKGNTSGFPLSKRKIYIEDYLSPEDGLQELPPWENHWYSSHQWSSVVSPHLNRQVLWRRKTVLTLWVREYCKLSIGSYQNVVFFYHKYLCN